MKDSYDNHYVPRRTVERVVYADPPGHNYKGAPVLQCLVTVDETRELGVKFHIEVLDCREGTLHRTEQYVQAQYAYSGGWLDHALRTVRETILERGKEQ